MNKKQKNLKEYRRVYYLISVIFVFLKGVRYIYPKKNDIRSIKRCQKVLYNSLSCSGLTNPVDCLVLLILIFSKFIFQLI